MHNKKGTVIFAVGTGRCGTNFLHKVFSEEPLVTSHHERFPLEDSFHRYMQWNKLQIDHGGFLAVKNKGIVEDLAKTPVSFESSAYMSLSIQELYEKFDAKFIFMVRDPHKVVNSFIQKDWYEEPVIREDISKPVNVQPNVLRPHHNFTRLAPFGDGAVEWDKYSRVGKVAWFWKIINQNCIDQLENIPESHKCTFRLEDFNYSSFKSLEKMFGVTFNTTENDYNRLVKSKPNKLNPQKTVESWDEKEREEYLKEVGELSDYFGYSKDFNLIIDKEKKKSGQKENNKSFFQKIFK